MAAVAALTTHDKSPIEPSENWDDDFEFQDSNAAASGRGRRSLQHNRDQTVVSASSSKVGGGDGSLGSKMDLRKLSVASSAITEDWDLEEGPSTASIPESAIPILQGTSTSSSNAAAAIGLSSLVTENWDDDFEDSRNSPAKRPLGPIRKSQGGHGGLDEEPEESWDEEDEEDGEANDFGFGGKDEEDRTVTARSRRAAIARMTGPSAQHSPPPPVPAIRTSSLTSHPLPLPHPFPRTPSSPGAPRPRSRSPTSTASVFSVPNTVSAYSYSSTTHLNGHPRSHRPNSAFALLPPSPPIHKERERRRLRKKSRPAPQGVFEMADVGMSSAAGGRYSFSDNEADGTESRSQPRGTIGTAYAYSSQMDDIRSRESISSIDEGSNEGGKRAEDKSATTSTVQRGRGQSIAPLSVPATPTKGGTAAAMLSRIGSVKKWGVAVRNRRRGSTTPSEVAAQQDQEREQELQRTPRPRSSMSSFNADSSSHSRSRYIPRNFNRHSATVTSTSGVATPGSPTSSSSHWFFRASSTGSPSRGGSNLGRSRMDAVGGPGLSNIGGPSGGGLSRGHSTRTTSSARSGRSRSRSRSRPPVANAGRARDGDGGLGNLSETGNGREVATPNNKLIKRKSLGFVKLGMGSSAGGHDGVGSKYPGLGLGRAAEKEKAKEDVDEPRSRRKSFSRFLKDRAERESSQSPGSSPFVVVDAQPSTSAAPPTPTPGSRTFMGSVRRISLVGRHKRSKSGALLGEVPPSPSSAFFRQPGPESVPPVPYSLPPLPGSASASASQLSLKMAASSTSALNLPLPVQKRSTSGKRIVSNSSQTSSVMPPSTSSSVSKASVHKRRTSEEGRSRPSIGAGRRSLDFDLSIFQANVRQAAKEKEEEDEVIDDMKTPSKSSSVKPNVSSLKPPPPLPLLPPIELHPPSPPNTITPTSALGPSNSDRGKASRSLSAAFGTGSGTDALSPATSTSSIFFTPTSSPNKSHKNSTKLSPGTKSPASQQSASLGRSTAGTVSAGVSAVEAGLGTTPHRRNSLGDLKIPARISQAQVALRRDLGMVREFASNVEQIKDLQQTYNSLVSEVQAILDDHAHRHAQQAFLAASMSSAQPHPRSASPSFLSGLAIRTRGRSNTNPSPTPPVISSQRPSIDENPGHGQILPYKELASKFYTINSKYRLSWECAELLIELGGTGNGENATTNTSQNASSNPGVVTSAPANTNPSSPVMQHAQGAASVNRAVVAESNAKGRERTITLVGDHDKPSNLKQHSHLDETTNPPPPLVSPPSVSTSQSNSSWRASTGRHDLSHRQLSLLREMLNNTHAIVSSSAFAVGADDGLGGAGDDSQQSIPEDSIPARRIPLAVQSLQAVHMTASASLHVNRDWRWGDARNSTITLPSEEDNALGDGAQRGGKTKQKDGRRKSGRMGMAGFRDMLRALRRGAAVDAKASNSATNPGGFISQSTTSLSTQSSVGSRKRGGHRYPHPKLPPPPAATSAQQPAHSQGRRRAKTSIGPESIKSTNTAAQATLTSGIGLGMKPSTSSSYGAGAGKPSPRRPSLASIFRIGGVKNRPGSMYVGPDDVVPVLSPPPPPSATTVASPSTDHEVDLEGRSEDSHSHGHGFSGSSSTGEEDWDRMDSASDLDAAARAMGVRVGTDNGATVRGGGGAKLQKSRKGRSPYLHRDMYDPPPPMPTDQTSPISPSGYSIQHSIVSKRSFNNSQSSLSRPHHGSPLTSSHVPTRTTKLSNVNEHQDDRHPSFTKQQQTKSPTRPSSSRSNFAPALSPNGNAQSGSMRSVAPPHLSPSASMPISNLVSSMPDPMKLAMTPENIKPLLENAKEVHARLGECIEEIMSLLGRVPASAVSEPVAI